MAKLLSWAGSVPKTCNLCKSNIDRHFVDGVVSGMGWAIMCVECHKQQGHGLGTGRGQLYRLDVRDGKFYKIEG